MQFKVECNTVLSFAAAGDCIGIFWEHNEAPLCTQLVLQAILENERNPKAELASTKWSSSDYICTSGQWAHLEMFRASPSS